MLGLELSVVLDEELGDDQDASQNKGLKPVFKKINPSTWEVEAEDQEFKVIPNDTEFETSLSSKRSGGGGGRGGVR